MRIEAERPLRAAVVGVGNIGAVHVRALSAMSGAQIVALCDIDPAHLAAGQDLAMASAAQAGHRPTGYAELEEMLEHERPDVLHICTPHYLHAPMATQALGRGARVLMEKPMAMDMTEGEALARTQEASGLEAGLCFQNRYRRTAIEAKRIVSSNDYGRLLGIRAFLSWKRDAAYYASGGWRGRWATEGGGLLINQAIHTLDLIQWIGGGCVGAKAIGGNLSLEGVIEVEDTAVVAMDLPGGARGMLFATSSHMEDAPVEIEIVCEGCRLRMVNDLVLFERKGGGASRELSGRVLASDSEAPSDARRPYWGSGHAALISDFYDCLRTGRPFALNLREGLKTLAILDRAYSCIGRPKRIQGD
jgi:predicted dehydrogenase